MRDGAKFIRERITELRIKKNISECKLSHELGHSNSYIRGITSGRALPSMSEFLYICEYFGITPKEFFDDENSEPFLTQKLSVLSKKLSKEDLTTLTELAERLAAKN